MPNLWMWCTRFVDLVCQTAALRPDFLMFTLAWTPALGFHASTGLLLSTTGACITSRKSAILRYSGIGWKLSKDCFWTISEGPGGIAKRLSRDCFWDPRGDPRNIVKKYPQEGSNRPKDCQKIVKNNL